MGDEAGRDHADHEADKVADIIGVKEFKKFSYYFNFHKEGRVCFKTR